MATAPSRFPWPAHALVWYYRHPLVGYFVLFVVAVLWVVTPRRTEAVAMGAILLPWLVLGLGLLNAPLVGGAIKRLTLPLPVRRNHALEHGTIQLLRRAYGVKRGIGGRAASDGFRLSGARAPEDIRRAFGEFVSLPVDQRLAQAVANQCGSMLVITQGLALALMFATLVAVWAWQARPHEAGLLLGLQFILFLAGRRPLGRLIQRRRLLALDFDSASIRSIDKVQANHLTEWPPVYFIRTAIDVTPKLRAAFPARIL